MLNNTTVRIKKQVAINHLYFALTLWMRIKFTEVNVEEV